MAASILDDVKKTLGVDPSYTVFDGQIIMHINTVFSILNQLGIGSDFGYQIADNTATWDLFIGLDPQLNDVKTYVSMRVRMFFDPPTNSFVIAAMEKQIQELEWRINVKREGVSWVDPNPPTDPDESTEMESSGDDLWFEGF